MLENNEKHNLEREREREGGVNKAKWAEHNRVWFRAYWAYPWFMTSQDELKQAQKQTALELLY